MPGTDYIDSLKEQAAIGNIDSLLKIMGLLRSPAGCPWDREQSHKSLVSNLLEEAHEAADAIISGNENKICEELGDLLLQVVFHAQIGSENGAFAFEDVVRAIASKLIRRHPHIFGNAEATTAGEVNALWQQVKEGEAGTSNLHQLPALLQLQKMVATGSLGADAVKDELLQQLVCLVERAQAQSRCLEAEVKYMVKKT